MKALTLIRPWAAAVAHLGKNVENRTWRPPAALIGQRFAIHAGKREDLAVLRAITLEQLDRGLPMMRDAGPQGIVCTVRLAAVFTAAGVVHADERIATAKKHGRDFWRWYMGPVGWVLDDVRTLATPVPCRGAQGLWTLPADVEAAVMAQEGRAA